MGYKDIICGIYYIENIITKQKYIGQSHNIYDRWRRHKGALKNNTHYNDLLQESWNKYGSDCFIFKIIQECSSEQLDELEKHYIKKYNTTDIKNGFNLQYGGKEGIPTEYSLNKQSDSLKESYKKAGRKELQRENALKQWANPEIKAKILGKNNGMYGKTHTVEAREKIRQAKLGSTPAVKNLKPVYCQELNKVFENATEAGKFCNRQGGTILQVCYGNRKTCGGYHWNFYLENNVS